MPCANGPHGEIVARAVLFSADKRAKIATDPPIPLRLLINFEIFTIFYPLHRFFRRTPLAPPKRIG